VALLLVGCGGDDGVGTEGPPATQGPPGPEGPQGEQDEPTISAVTPSWLWLSRSELVTISGYDTAWTDGATVDFGPGVTVSDVVVASPTSIVATVSVAETAAVGAHDVVVTADDGELTSAGGFEVRPGMQVVHVLGDGTQGSFNVFAVSVDDPQHDLAGGMFTEPGAGFAHTVEGAARGIHPLFSLTGEVYYEPGFAQFEAVVDVNAPAEGPLSLVTTSLNGRDTISTGLFEASARTPEALTLDTPVITSYGSVPFSTHLFEYANDSGSDQLVDLTVGNGGGGEVVAMYYARASGDASDGFVAPIQALPVGVRDGESVYLMAVGAEGDVDFDFAAEAGNARSAAMFASQETDDDACADAQDTGIELSDQEGFVIDGGMLDEPITTNTLGAGGGESDWYRFSTSEAATTLACVGHGNNDVVAFLVYASDNCDDELATTVDLPAGDYLMRVVKQRQVTMRGSTRYAVVCTVTY
jgi:hypothetical protein